MNIIYLITLYEVGDGTSEALNKQVQYDKINYDDYLIVTKKIISTEENLSITTINNYEKITEFTNKTCNTIVNYFKSRSSNILMDLLELIGYSIPIITTICQSPSYPNLWLTPFELKNSWHFVFIDKAAYNNKLINFIPEKVKSQIYLSSQRDIDFKSIRNINNGNKIVYGRGSSSIKCPSNMFEVFDRIDVPNKLFRIVGIEENSWITKEASKRNNVEVYGKLSKEKWIEMCNSFDVFLYQLPEDCFSSIDGTLGLAMMLGKPVVYMGCSAPKERFHNNQNGFVAESIEEMAHYATILGKDSKLRNEIGEQGRLSTINDFKPETRIQKYKELYQNIHTHTTFHIPYSYILFFLIKNKKQTKEYIRGILRIKFKTIYHIYRKLKRKRNEH